MSDFITIGENSLGILLDRYIDNIKLSEALYNILGKTCKFNKIYYEVKNKNLEHYTLKTQEDFSRLPICYYSMLL